MNAPKLKAEGLCLAFGGLAVTRDVTLALAAGARTALIGPNGAGKTTLVNLLSGALKPQAGTIWLDGAEATGLSQAERVRAGLVRTYQISRLFRDLSVHDNVRQAVLQQQRLAMRPFLRRPDEERVRDLTEEALRSLALSGLSNRIVGTLALGQQRLVEIALALAMKPRVLLLDEPAAGVPQGESGRIFDAIEQLPSELAILLIEHDMDLVFRFANHIIVLASGAVLVSGTPTQIAVNEQVKQIYFGRASHDPAIH
jgi:ABC-type branched-subunit amino acid transport system ATPase component